MDKRFLFFMIQIEIETKDFFFFVEKKKVRKNNSFFCDMSVRELKRKNEVVKRGRF